jgi:hypothetical protein
MTQDCYEALQTIRNAISDDESIKAYDEITKTIAKLEARITELQKLKIPPRWQSASPPQNSEWKVQGNTGVEPRNERGYLGIFS